MPNSSTVKQDLPITPEQWLDEVRLGIVCAKKAKPFGWLTCLWSTDANLFHLAPLMCMKLRSLDYRDKKLRREVTEGALATYVVNSDPNGINHGLNSRPLLAFAVCYLAAHYILDLIDGREVEKVLDYCEEHLD